MASNKVSNAHVKITVDGQQAIAFYSQLQKRERELAASVKAGNKDSEKELNQVRGYLTDIKNEMQNIGDVVKGKVFANLATLERMAKQVKMQMKYAENIQDLRQLQTQYRVLTDRIREMTNQTQQSSHAFGRLAQRAAEYTGFYMLFNRSRQIITSAIQGNLKLSDSISDIQKVSGLSEEAVKGLVGEIEKLDSRNAPSVLNNMAYAAGKLGIKGAENLLGFTRAADKLNVALKEYLGDGAEGVVSLMKFANVMGTTDQYGVEQALLKTGSALNYMTQSTAAAADYMIDFAGRFGPIARQARMTSGDVIGLASALDALTVNNEEAATSLQKFVVKLLSSPTAVSKALGMDAQLSKQMVETGKSIELVEMALAKLGERAEKYGVSGIASVIGDIGSKGQAQRLIKTLATLSNNTEMVANYVTMANDAFNKGTSVIDEYNIKNQNAAAIMERMKNSWTKIMVNSQEVGVVKELAQELYDMSYELQHNRVLAIELSGAFKLLFSAVKALVQLLPVLLPMLTTIGALNLVKIIGGWTQAILASGAAMLSNLKVLFMYQMQQWGLVTANGAMTVSTYSAAAAFHSLKVALASTGIGLFVIAVGALAAALIELSTETSRADKQTNKLKDSFNSYNSELIRSQRELQGLFNKLRAANTEEKERINIINQINQKYGQYLENLLSEKSSLDEIADAQREITKQLRQQLAYKAKMDYLSEAEKDAAQSMGDAMEFVQGALDKLYGKYTKGKYADYFGMKKEELMNTIVQEVQAEVSTVVGGKYASRQEAVKAIYEIINRRYGEVLSSVRNQPVTGSGAAAAANVGGAGHKADANINLDREAVKQLNVGITKLVDAAFTRDENIHAGKLKYDKFIGGWMPDAVVEGSGGGTTDVLPEGMTAEERKAELERQKALRMEMKAEQEKAKAIIDNVKNYYERQINAITQLATEVGMDPKIQEQMVDGMTVRMNNALANVRKAIGGTENEWEEFKQTMRQDLYEPLDESGENFSTELLDKVMENNVEELRKMIEVLSQELNQQGSVLLDQILRKATENEGKNAKLANKLMREREKELLAKDYTGKVDKDTEGIMEQFGIAGLTSQQSAQIRDWSLAGNDKEIETFLQERSQMWQEAFVKARENAIKLMQTDVNREGGQDAVLSLLFGEDYKETLQGSALEGMLNMSLDQWQVFYMKLIEYGDKWVDAQKKQYDEIKKRQDYLFNLRPDIRAIDESIKALKERDDQLKKLGVKNGSKFGEMIGFMNIENDPELVRLQLIEERAERYYENMKRLREQNYADEAQVTSALNALVEAQSATQERLIARINDRAEKLATMGEPIAELGSEIGKAMYDQWHNGESMTMKWQDMLKKVGLAWGELTVKVTSELMMQKIKQKILDRAMQMEETAHQTAMAGIQQAGAATRTTIEEASGASRIAAEQSTNAILETEQAAHNTNVIQEDTSTAVDENAINTSRAAGKTLADLGWWGIPLVAVITALLNMLLQAALGTSQHKANQSKQKEKTLRLASGMLVYDEGNVKNLSLPPSQGGGTKYLGTDGRTYKATATPTPEGTALVRHPIATMIGGQPALVGERGTELIIGRRTLRDMSQFRPDLLQQLYAFERRRFRTYDSGNVGEMAGITELRNNGGQDPQMQETLQSLTQTVALLSSTVDALQRNGIYAKINKYGAGGLVDEVADGLYTTKKRGNNNNVRRLFG